MYSITIFYLVTSQISYQSLLFGVNWDSKTLCGKNNNTIIALTVLAVLADLLGFIVNEF